MCVIWIPLGLESTVSIGHILGYLIPGFFVCVLGVYHIDGTGKGIGKSIGTGLLRVGLAGLVWLVTGNTGLYLLGR